MILELAISFLYEWIQASWLASSILVKYVLLGFLGFELSQKKDIKQIKNDLNDYGDHIVGLMVLTGFILHITGLSPEPVLPVVGEVTALAFYFYLFWKY